VRAHQFDPLPNASQRPADARWSPLGAVAPPISPSQPTPRPKPAVRAKRRFARWQTEIGRESYAGAKTDEDVERAQRAYEAKLAEGPDWGHDKIGATAYANLDKKGTQ